MVSKVCAPQYIKCTMSIGEGIGIEKGKGGGGGGGGGGRDGREGRP